MSKSDKVQQRERSASAHFTGTYFYSKSVKQGINVVGIRTASSLISDTYWKLTVFTYV